MNQTQTNHDKEYWLERISEIRNLYSGSSNSLVSKLIETNTHRKAVVKEAVLGIENKLKEIKENSGDKILEKGQKTDKSRFFISENIIWIEGGWNKGIVGLIASRLCNQYNIPTVVVSLMGEEK